MLSHAQTLRVRLGRIKRHQCEHMLRREHQKELVEAQAPENHACMYTRKPHTTCMCIHTRTYKKERPEDSLLGRNQRLYRSRPSRKASRIIAARSAYTLLYAREASIGRMHIRGETRPSIYTYADASQTQVGVHRGTACECTHIDMGAKPCQHLPHELKHVCRERVYPVRGFGSE